MKDFNENKLLHIDKIQWIIVGSCLEECNLKTYNDLKTISNNLYDV